MKSNERLKNIAHLAELICLHTGMDGSHRISQMFVFVHENILSRLLTTQPRCFRVFFRSPLDNLFFRCSKFIADKMLDFVWSNDFASHSLRTLRFGEDFLTQNIQLAQIKSAVSIVDNLAISRYRLSQAIDFAGFRCACCPFHH